MNQIDTLYHATILIGGLIKGFLAVIYLNLWINRMMYDADNPKERKIPNKAEENIYHFIVLMVNLLLIYFLI